MKQLFFTVILTLIVQFSATTPLQAFEVESLSLNTIFHFASGFFSNENTTNDNEREYHFFGNRKAEVNLNNSENHISILSAGFTPIAENMEHFQSGLEVPNLEDDPNVAAAVIGKALVYPNPFRQETGSRLGYRLSKNMDLEVHVYDMMANLILKKTFRKGSVGARKGYNKVNVDLKTWDNFFLSAGVYFYVLINDDNVLAKGKMAVIP